MPASLISFTSKVNAINRPDIPTINKARAQDLNEVKTVVNVNAALIDTNTADVATNTSDITTNTSDIATNTADIATNTADVATNTADIATNTEAITPGTSSSTAIDLSSRAGTVHSNGGLFMSDTAFTLAADPAELGFGIILSNAASLPAVAGATAHSNYATDYQLNQDNLIAVHYINGVARYQIVFV